MKAIITGVIGSDAHIIGNRILARSLEKEGFNVISLGALTPAEEFINAAIETDADAIVISSLYGQAYFDCQGIGDKCLEAGLHNIKLYIGGNLAISSSENQDFNEIEKMYKDLGFHRVYPSNTNIKEFIKQLKEDLYVHE